MGWYAQRACDGLRIRADTTWVGYAASLLLIIGATDVAFAIDRARTETGVDKAVDSLGVSGEGVIVAILDRGIDWESNDFRNEDGSTRIAYIFDLSDDSGAQDPDNDYGRGTVYTRQEIDHALSTGARLATRDGSGHGTTSTGIPAGNGRNSTGARVPRHRAKGHDHLGEGHGRCPCARGRTGRARLLRGRSGSLQPRWISWWTRHRNCPCRWSCCSISDRSADRPTAQAPSVARSTRPSAPNIPAWSSLPGPGDDGIPSHTQNRAAGDVPEGGAVDLRFELDTGEADLQVWYDRDQELAVSIETPDGTFGPYPATRFYSTGTGFQGLAPS